MFELSPDRDKSNAPGGSACLLAPSLNAVFMACSLKLIVIIVESRNENNNVPHHKTRSSADEIISHGERRGERVRSIFMAAVS